MRKKINKEKIFLIVNIGAIAGFFIGVVLFYHQVIEQRYFQYKMYRLLCLSLQDHLNKWILISIFLFICGAFFITLFSAWIFVSSHSERSYVITKRISFSVLSALLFLNLANIIESKIKNPETPNILLIVIDCLKTDHLGCYGYERATSPTIDLLAQKGVLFENAYSNAPWTKPSVATIFSSLYPNEHNVINSSSAMPDGILTMAEILKNNGYNTFFFNGGNAFLKKIFNFDQGFDTYIYRPHKATNAAAITNDFINYIQTLDNGKYFAYLHYMDAHTPYTRNGFNYYFTDNNSNLFKPGDRTGGFKNARELTLQNRLSDSDKRHVVSLYDGQIRFVDENIKRIVEFLGKANQLKGTVIIITSDHGEEFWEHNNFEHGHSLYNELLHVPLIIFDSNIEKHFIADRVRLIDLLPTIMDICDIKKSDLNFSGVNLMNLTRGLLKSIDLPVFASGTLYGPEKYCLIKGNDKIIQNTDMIKGKSNLIGYSSPYKLEMYDLNADSFEKNNLEEHIEATDVLQKELKEFESMKPLFHEDKSIVVLDGETKEKLEALGYLQ